MTSDSPAKAWIRCLTVALCGWCGVFGTLTALSALSVYLRMFGPSSYEDSITILIASFTTFGSALAVLVTIPLVVWQWKRMQNCSRRDHLILSVFLVILAVAVGPQPFFYATF